MTSMQMSIPCLLLALIGCQSLPHTPSERAISELRVRMSAHEVLEIMIPVLTDGPARREIAGGQFEYVFGTESQQEVRVVMANPKQLPALGPQLPNGEVVAIYPITRKTRWVYQYEDANQIE